MVYNDFGDRLRLLREKMGLSQGHFAELGGVKRLTQHLYEQNARVPDLTYLAKLSLAGADVRFLLEPILGTPSVAGSVPSTPRLLAALFRAVDEHLVDDQGRPASAHTREKMFLALAEAAARGEISADSLNPVPTAKRA